MATNTEEIRKLKKQLEALTGIVDDLQEESGMKDAMIVEQAEEINKLKLAKDNPVQIRTTHDTREMDITEEKERTMSPVGDAVDALSSREIEVIDSFNDEKMKELAFMEELVTIRVHDTTDESQVPVPAVWNDGRAQYFIRGEEQTVKRKYVERLARAKITRFSQRKEYDDDGNEIYVQVPHTALIYPFEVIKDDNPRGAQWLRDIVNDPQ